MGAWAADNFGNDDALDFVVDLEDSRGSQLLVEKLSAVLGGDESEMADAPECCEALAAAEIVAALRGKSCGNLPEEAENWLQKSPPTPDAALVDMALRAVKQVRTRSELKFLWEDSDHYEEWTSVLDDLENRLRS